MSEVCLGNCGACSNALEQASSIEDFERRIKRLAEEALDESYSTDTELGIPEFPGLIPGYYISSEGEVFDIDSTDAEEATASDMRKYAAGMIDELASRKERREQDLRDLVRDCAGPQVVKGSSGGVEHDILVCASPMLPDVSL